MSIQKAYNSWSDIYDSNENKTRDLDRKVTLSVLSEYDFEKVLELGCGTGKNTEFLLSKSNKLTAVDFSEGMLTKAKTKFPSENVKFIQADITETWNFTTEKFDLITCNLILEHIENLNFIFQQAFEKLEKNGKFFICELHPFKQYTGTKARYETDEGIHELEVYTHHITGFTDSALKNGFKLLKLQEWFDEPNENGLPRLVSFVFEK